MSFSEVDEEGGGVETGRNDAQILIAEHHGPRRGGEVDGGRREDGRRGGAVGHEDESWGGVENEHVEHIA